MEWTLIICGWSQVGLALASLFIPRVLGWRRQLSNVDPLLANVFWTYACYILGTNLCMGFLSALAPELLTDGSPLARCVAGYVTLYWGARLTIQLFGFGKHAPEGTFFKLAEGALLLLFAAWTVVYGMITFGHA